MEKQLNTCETCQHFRGFTKRPKKGNDVRYGECRRYPPTYVHDEGYGELGGKYLPASWMFPRVTSMEGCGEHKQKEQTNGGKK